MASGAATLVKNEAKQRVRSEKSRRWVEVQGGIFVNVHAPPRAREELFENLAQTAIAQRIPENKALWKEGGFHETPGGTATTLLENFRPDTVARD